MTAAEYKPIYPFRPENFEIVQQEHDWAVGHKEDVFYGNGFATGPNVPSPSCINDVLWYAAQEQEPLPQDLEEAIDLQLKQRMCFNKPIC